MLFGVGYGTGVRIGYEQVYPLLFPKANATNIPNAEQVRTNLKSINDIYNTIGGKEASNMGIAQGINSVRSATENNPDFQYLEELESRMSGRTPSNLDRRNKSSTESSPQVELSDNYDEIADYISRITNRTRAQLLDDRNFLEGGGNPHWSKQDRSIILQLVNDALENQKGAAHTEAYEITFRDTLSKMSDKGIQSMMVSLKSFPQWQQDIIAFINGERKRQSVKDTDERFTPKLREYDIQRNAYKERREKLLNSIKSFKEWIIKAKSLHNVIAEKSERKKQETARKKLINFITISRNNLNLKSLANPDWNHRIWKAHTVA